MRSCICMCITKPWTLVIEDGSGQMQLDGSTVSITAIVNATNHQRG